jgi:hypothetical protein
MKSIRCNCFVRVSHEKKPLKSSSETVQLLKTRAILSLFTVENEGCFSTLHLIKTFVQYTVGRDRLNALAGLSTTRQFIISISDFNKEITDVFSRTQTGEWSSTTCEILRYEILLHNKVTQPCFLCHPLG